MELVLDTNILFALPRSSVVRELVGRLLLERRARLLVPQFVIEELIALKGELMRYAGFDEEEFVRYLRDISILAEVVPVERYEPFSGDAKRISPHAKDVPLFALSLKFNKAPIWSREPRLKRQKFVEVLDDKGIEKLLEEP